MTARTIERSRKTAARRNSIFQLRISLDGIAPPIWRRVLVPASSTLRRLHRVIQESMGRTSSHLHMFEIDGRQFGRPDPQGGLYLEDDSRRRLHELVVAPGDMLAYEYDFGDSWRHSVLLEAVPPVEAAGNVARCIAGARACPPEDCGGIPGYQAEADRRLSRAR
jgi:hypothetical protein